MWRRVLLAILSAVLPRHPRAERAVRTDTRDIASLVTPTILPKAQWILALLPYRDERVRALIQAVKYHGEKDVAEKVAPYITDHLTELLTQKMQFEGWHHVLLVPIPTSPQRLRERGYAQAELYARAVAARTPDIRLDESLLVRDDRVSQVRVPRTLRHTNIRGAFRAASSAHGAYIILLDDVVESGATLTDARRALLDAGAQGVIALAVAH